MDDGPETFRGRQGKHVPPLRKQGRFGRCRARTRCRRLLGRLGSAFDEFRWRAARGRWSTSSGLNTTRWVTPVAAVRSSTWPPSFLTPTTPHARSRNGTRTSCADASLLVEHAGIDEADVVADQLVLLIDGAYVDGQRLGTTGPSSVLVRAAPRLFTVDPKRCSTTAAALSVGTPTRTISARRSAPGFVSSCPARPEAVVASSRLEAWSGLEPDTFSWTPRQ